MSNNKTLHYGVIAIPKECEEQFLEAAKESSHYIELEYSYSNGDIYYYSIHDPDKSIVVFCEDLANHHGIPHNLYPNNLDHLMVVARFTSQGELQEFYTEYSNYIECRLYPENINDYSPKLPGLYEWEDKWENQVHYGRVGLLKRQLEGK